MRGGESDYLLETLILLSLSCQFIKKALPPLKTWSKTTKYQCGWTFP